MGLYERYVLPHLIHYACGQGTVSRQREKVIPKAHGRVLEVGVGTGLNLPFYDASQVTEVIGIDPSKKSLRMAEKSLGDVGFDCSFVEALAEDIPLEKDSVDVIVVTYTLCTIPNASQALCEMHRVLKPGGELLFSEHGIAPDKDVRKWQRRLNPFWSVLSGGCQLTRRVPSMLEKADFTVNSLGTAYLPGWKIASYNYWGRATPK